MNLKKNNTKQAISEAGHFFQQPAVRYVLIAGGIFASIYLSRYFINAMAETVRACKNLREACGECTGIH